MPLKNVAVFKLCVQPFTHSFINIMQIIMVFFSLNQGMSSHCYFYLFLSYLPFLPRREEKKLLHSWWEWDQDWKRYFIEKSHLSTQNPALRRVNNPAHWNHLENKKRAEQACSAQPSHRAPFQVKTGLVWETCEEMWPKFALEGKKRVIEVRNGLFFSSPPYERQ